MSIQSVIILFVWSVVALNGIIDILLSAVEKLHSLKNKHALFFKKLTELKIPSIGLKKKRTTMVHSLKIKFYQEEKLIKLKNQQGMTKSNSQYI